MTYFCLIVAIVLRLILDTQEKMNSCALHFHHRMRTSKSDNRNSFGIRPLEMMSSMRSKEIGDI